MSNQETPWCNKMTIAILYVTQCISNHRSYQSNFFMGCEIFNHLSNPRLQSYIGFIITKISPVATFNPWFIA